VQALRKGDTREPTVDLLGHGSGCTGALDGGFDTDVDRVAQAPSAAQLAGCGCGRFVEQLGFSEPEREVGGGNQRLDVSAPALAMGVNEVDRRTTTEPVPPWRSARERKLEIIG
jgi:hypothetical protein